jgi:hypothetical protein
MSTKILILEIIDMTTNGNMDGKDGGDHKGTQQYVYETLQWY